MNSHYSQDEIEYLLEICGTGPFSEVARKYRRKAKAMGWPMRTQEALKCCANRHGAITRPHIDNMGAYQWGKALGLPVDRICHWYRRFGLPFRKHGKLVVISQASMKEYANQRPHQFAGANEDACQYFFGEELANKIQDAGRKRHPRKRKKVYCKKTGAIYPSLKAAARANFMSPGTMRRRIKKGVDFEEVLK